MFMKELLMQAKEDYKNLKKVVENHTGTLEELKEKLEGFNLQQKLFFDVNFGIIKAMVYYDFQTNKIGLCEEVDICDKDSCEIVSKNYIMEE